jgi:hypothetical protein
LSNDIDPLIRSLVRNQNPDGGWSYVLGTSWTEPTCYAVLALRSAGDQSGSAARGHEWILKQQRLDGGWAPQPVVAQSTWVTSLASLTLVDDHPNNEAWAHSIRWLCSQFGQQSRAVDRLRAWLFGSDATRSEPAGWPWVPGTASWVTPTVMTIVALSKASEDSFEPNNEGALRIATRVRQGQQFLLSRRCADGGWNHGGTSFRSESAVSYPEMTGMALIGLQNISVANLDRTLDRAQSLLTSSGSSEGTSWLQIALASHKRRFDGSNAYPVRTNYDLSLRILADAALNGRNVFSLAHP